MQRLGRQILEALLFLRERGFPAHGHLHSGNVILQNGVARYVIYYIFSLFCFYLLPFFTLVITKSYCFGVDVVTAAVAAAEKNENMFSISLSEKVMSMSLVNICIFH